MHQHIFYFVFLYVYFFQLPKEFDAAQLLDLFYKVHIVLNINFDPNLHKMMMFVQSLIFKFREGKNNFKPTAHMLKVFDELNENLE